MSKDKLITESNTAMNVERLLEEYDADISKSRKLTGLIEKLTIFMAIAMSLFHLYTARFGTLLSAKQDLCILYFLLF